MEIRLEGIGKKFGNEWIFRHLDAVVPPNSTLAITGRNGAGKSTLLQIIAGNLSPSAGKISWTLQNRQVDPAQLFRHLTLVAPYQELIEEFTLGEMIRFHFSFKNILKGFSLADLIAMTGFTDPLHKPIRQFSSGMKQRVKLLLAFFSDVPLILLDEPTMNLDEAGIGWYNLLVRNHTSGRTLVICSNQIQTEAAFALRRIDIQDFRGKQ